MTERSAAGATFDLRWGSRWGSNRKWYTVWYVEATLPDGRQFCHDHYFISRGRLFFTRPEAATRFLDRVRTSPPVEFGDHWQARII